MVSRGSRGTSTKIWCKKDESGKPIFLSPEEEEIKNKLLKKWFATADEKTVLVSEMVRSGEITSAEAWQYYSDIMHLPNSYAGFVKDFKMETGC